MKDLQGRPYIKLSQLKEGDKVICDGDFTCIPPWAERTVKDDFLSGFYIDCKEGKHFLDDQLYEDEDTLIGFCKKVT